ncbi:MAG: Cytochrome oxidase assembly [Vezdaea acicularis]|nr:MAG: Cytochrome oxidase assembly [Vezdaea acicularis]
MPPFQRKPFLPSSFNDTVAAKYRVQLKRHPFLLFGLPFIITMVAGSFFLTPATALRYEKQDRKVRQMSQEEALGLGKDRRRVTMDVAAEEYYRLAAKDLDNWEQRRVKRLPGEPDGIL